MRKTSWKVFTLAMPVLLMVIGGNWFSDVTLHDFSDDHSWRYLISLCVASLALFFFGAYWLYKLRQEFLPVRVLSKTDKITPRKVLITIISTRNFDFVTSASGERITRGTIVQHKVSKTTHTLTAELDKDTVSSGCEWNWQQVLRAVKPHVGTLERIYLIGSDGNKGSATQLDECTSLLRMYVSEICKIDSDPQGIDFEDLDAVEKRIMTILKGLRKEGRADTEIMLDSTGGLKTASIAVALVTLQNPRLQFQYVRMGNDKPLLFNVVAEGHVELG
jgi:hypothetical protein